MRKRLATLLVSAPLAIALTGCSSLGLPSWDEIDLAAIPLPTFSLPEVSLPSVSMPDISLPEFAVPSMPSLSMPSLPTFGVNSVIYRPDVAQGNLITDEMLRQVQVGMTRDQVHFILGEPLIRSDMHKKRWDYVYYYNPRKGDIEKRHVVVFFNDEDRLERLVADTLPTETQADAKILSYQ